MAGKANYLSNGLLNAIFAGTLLANLLQNASASPLTQFYISLHTADPGPAGTQATSEISYTGYARVAINRDNTSAGWTVSSAESVSPQANIIFPVCTGGSSPVAGYWGIGEAGSGAGNLLYSGPISPSITVSLGVQPELTTASTVTEA